MRRLCALAMVLTFVGAMVHAGDQNPVAADKGVGKKLAGLEWVHSRPAGIEFTKSEVTLAQYRACLEAGKCSEPRTRFSSLQCNWGYSNRDNHPINCVDWQQAKSFCEWVGGRLPTEKEWEAEASNNGSRKYPWGDEKVSCERAVMREEGVDGCGRDLTWPVCSKTLGNSVSGLCDMSGNVREWTSSLHRGDNRYRVVRGGSWASGISRRLRASSRRKRPPENRRRRIGLRCGRAVK